MYKALPASVRAKARLLLLDTIGCIVSGRSAGPVIGFERAFAELDQGDFSFPHGPALTVSAAASVAAMASAWDEGCEGLPYAHGRPGLALIGSLLPIAVTRRISTERLLTALIAGYELGARAGGWLRIGPGLHVDGNWPALGVAAGVCHLLELSAAQTWNAISLVACQLPASLYLPIRSGDDGRNTYPSHAASLGLQAALASAAGISAPSEALAEYARDHARPDGRPAPADDRWFILECYFKPHAGVRHAHYGLEAALRIRERLSRTTHSIRAALLRIYPEASVYAGNRDPQAPITAQFSLSLGVAAGLRFGSMDPDLFRSATLQDAELRRLERLVVIEADPTFGHDRQRAAILRVETDDAVFEERIDILDGDPLHPLDAHRLIEKFVRYSRASIDEERARAFAHALIEAEQPGGFDVLWRMLSNTPDR